MSSMAVPCSEHCNGCGCLVSCPPPQGSPCRCDGSFCMSSIVGWLHQCPLSTAPLLHGRPHPCREAECKQHSILAYMCMSFALKAARNASSFAWGPQYLLTLCCDSNGPSNERHLHNTAYNLGAVICTWQQVRQLTSR